MNNYFGSVRFFKHMIILTIVLMITIPSVSSITLYRKVTLLNKELSVIELPVLNPNDGEKVPLPSEGSSIDYQEKYPDLYVDSVEKIKSSPSEKAIYLTFDDGPSPRTLEVLKILNTYDVKATFFVVYKDDDASKEIYKAIVNEGHTIAIHTASHQYTEIYQSVDAYLSDFQKINDLIVETTGVKPTLFRFPGGSLNSHNVATYEQIIAEMLRRGYTFHDWNVTSSDTINTSTSESIYNSVIDNIQKYNKSVVLFHDSASKKNTVQALPRIILYMQQNGYDMKPLDPTVIPYTFTYKN